MSGNRVDNKSEEFRGRAIFILFVVEKNRSRDSSFFVNKMLNSDRISDTAHGDRVAP